MPLRDKVILTDKVNDLGTRIYALDPEASEQLHPELRRVVEHLIHSEVRRHNRYCPCCRRYEQGSDLSPQQMGEFLEYVRQVYLKLRRNRRSMNRSKLESAEDENRDLSLEEPSD